MSQPSNGPAPAPFQPMTVTPAEIPQSSGQIEGVPLQAVKPRVKKQKKTIPSEANEVIGAKITVLYRDERGEVREAAVTVSDKDFIIQHHTLEQKKMFKKVNEENGDTSFEDTGERTLTFKLRFHVK
jgi:hypothetical protein